MSIIKGPKAWELNQSTTIRFPIGKIIPVKYQLKYSCIF